MKETSHIIRIPHIKIGVSDMKKSVNFYQDILGLEKIGEWPTYAVFEIAGVELGLEPKAKPGIFFLVDDVDQAYQDLKDRGANFTSEPSDKPWGGRTANLVDPDGNTLAIETFQCKVCGKTCQSYRELLEEHLRKHKDASKERKTWRRPTEHKQAPHRPEIKNLISPKPGFRSEKKHVHGV